MRTSILLARKHGETAFTLLAGPETPIAEQRQVMHGLMIVSGVHDDFAEVQHWETDCPNAIQRILKFVPTKDHEARQAKLKGEYKAHQAREQAEREEREETLKPKKAKGKQADETKKPEKPDKAPAETKADL